MSKARIISVYSLKVSLLLLPKINNVTGWAFLEMKPKAIQIR